MKPDDLVEFSRLTYSRNHNVNSFSKRDFVDTGLSQDELDLLEKIPIHSGKLLLLGIGGGREAIPLGKMGFEITGVDFVNALVQKAKVNLSRDNIPFTGLVQEISELDVPQNSFDIVWLSTGMYSCIPTRSRRIAMILKVASALKPGGYFLCQFQINTDISINSSRGERIRYALSRLPLFNHSYEKGDTLWARSEFIHKFSSEDTIRKEFEEGGLQVEYLKFKQTTVRGGAICQKHI